MMSIEDWLPTLYSIAGGNMSDLPKELDGFNMWEALSENLQSPRNHILHNMVESRKIAALRTDNWKLVKGITGTVHILRNQYFDLFGPHPPTL